MMTGYKPLLDTLFAVTMKPRVDEQGREVRVASAPFPESSKNKATAHAA